MIDDVKIMQYADGTLPEGEKVTVEKAIENNIRELDYLGASHTNPTTKFEKYRICVISTFTALEKML